MKATLRNPGGNGRGLDSRSWRARSKLSDVAVFPPGLK
jgi:hypothetical protein